ncbi:MAG: exodeoxyribonuclease VII small subunit [Phycisphaerales bacterium]|nr:exodeoxyribonuclease VII small subunit [Phycisphaerales bacterium]
MNKSIRKLKFEEALTRLDAIVEAMEAGEIGVEESIARYEEAMQLAAHCRQILETAELRIQKIQLDATGRAELSDFVAPPDAGGTEGESGDSDSPDDV